MTAMKSKCHGLGDKSAKRWYGRRYLSVLSIGLLALMLFAGYTPGAAAEAPIRIGQVYPISGTVAWMGTDVEQGSILAVEQINAAGGINGRMLELVRVDGECAPRTAVTAARHLVDVERVQVMMGEVCSSATLAIEAILPSLQVPMVAFASSNPKITERAGVGGNPWMFRINLHDSVMAATLARKIANDGNASAALFAVNDDFGRGAVAAFQEAFKELNVRVTNVEYYRHGEPDYRAMLAKTRAANPDAIILVMEANDAAIFLRQFREQGMSQRLYARGSVVTAELLEQIKDDPSLAEGIEEASFWNVGLQTPQNVALNEAHLERWGRPPAAHGAMAYYAVYTIAEALKNAEAYDAASIQRALAAVDFESGIGRIRFDDHHQAHPLMTIATVVDGEIVLKETMPTDTE